MQSFSRNYPNSVALHFRLGSKRTLEFTGNSHVFRFSGLQSVEDGSERRVTAFFAEGNPALVRKGANSRVAGGFQRTLTANPRRTPAS